jgi:hypothetical protein
MATITDIDSSTENRALLQNIQNHLVLVLHAHECLKREQQPTNTNQTSSQNICTLQHCATMRNVLLHMKQCYDLQNCSCKFYYRSMKKTFFYPSVKIPIVFNRVL